ncbi:MAG: hypothetical protein ACLP9L_15035 [Thermoguttaceae bacterium]
MRPTTLSVPLLILLTAVAARAADMSIGANFTVLAPNQALAEAVAKQAELYRKQTALEWLGKELPDRVGRSLITVEITSQKDEGLTWPIDCPERTLHQVWLTTSVDRTLGTTLHHEVSHTVLDSYCYPESLPAWASEGIASQADDAGRKENQRQILARWSKAGRWPGLRPLFEASRIDHDNLSRYAAASSVTEFLAQRGGKTRVVEFASSGQKRGWDQAARDYYGVRDVAELQTAWQDWVTEKLIK